MSAFIACLCVCANLGHADRAGVQLCDALVGFVSSFPHPIILRENRNRMNKTRSSRFLWSWKRIKLTYSHFVSRLNVEHEILNYVHFVLGVDDMKTWDTDVNNEDRNLNLKKSSQSFCLDANHTHNGRLRVSGVL